MTRAAVFRLTAAIALSGFPLVMATPSKADDTASASVGSLTVKQAWLRATPNGAKVAGGYITIVNAGAAEDRLTGTSLQGTRKGEVHTMTMEGGVMHMAPLDAGLPIAPGATLTLKPGGYHLMFLDPAAPLKEGEHVDGTVTFAKAGTVKVSFVVGGMAAKTPP